MSEPSASGNGGASRASVRVLVDRVSIALFLLALVTPLVGWSLGVGTDRSASAFEMEAPRPIWSWRPSVIARYPREMQRYINAHFPFRGALMGMHAGLKISVFGVSSSDRVTIGKDGWLFYAGEQILDDYRRTRPFSVRELEAWRDLLVRRRDWLRARGSHFVFFVAPNPQTLYPELMPASVVRASNPSRLDQLMDYLRAHSDLDVLDMRPALIAAKRVARVCYQTDTHWNQYGGFIAYQEIARWLKVRFPTLKVLEIDDLERIEIPDWHGVLSYFLGAPWMFSETRVELRLRGPTRVLTDGQPLAADETADAWVRRRKVVRESADGEIPSAVVLRDSQFAAPAQYLSSHFRRSVLVWRQELDPELIERERPSVVIEEIAERLLMNEVPSDPPLP